MKKVYVTLLFIALFILPGYGQSCKYQTNEIDKFTGKITKLTKQEKVIGTFFTGGEFSVKRIDTTYFIIFNYGLSSYSNFDPYSVQSGAQIIFLMENGETITLRTEDNIKGTKSTVVGLPPVYCCNLTNVTYAISKPVLEKFLISKVKSIRFYRTESNGKEDYVDNDIKKKNQDDIQRLVGCIL